MKKLILHIGYPKTATTTLQNSLFYELHKQGVINYLGKKRRSHDETFDDHTRDIKTAVTDNTPGYHAHAVLKDDKVNVLSEETFAQPMFSMERKIGYANTDPFSFPQSLRRLFPEDTDCRVLITVRRQADLIFSLYAHQYRIYRKEQEYDTWDKFLRTMIRDSRKNFAVFYFHDLAERYAEVFGRDKTSILLFEDFKNDKNGFCDQLSAILGLDTETLKDNFADTSYKQKKRKDDSYLQEVANPTFASALLSRLKKLSHVDLLHEKLVKGRYGENNAFSVWYKNLNTRIQKALKRSDTYSIPMPTDEHRKMIFDEFRDSNMKLVDDFLVDRGKLQTYGYI